ncbi:two component system sensor kinase [Sodalis endosymbiont of Spalangia cameroni]|uniref:two component system sensor kinase n=1 Tax=Sodalis praecaptivus TaxID=1239307 RepID=UPI0031F7A5F5
MTIMKRQQSLVIKLTIFISISLIIIWLISVFAATYVSLNLSRHRILENLAHFSALRMELTNHRFEGAERDAQALANRYKLYHATPLMILPGEKSESRYFPFNPDNCIPPGKRERDRMFIQVFGTAGQTYYLDSFILDRRYGVSLLPPRDHTPDYFIRQQVELNAFPNQPAHDNLFWGRPEFLPGTGWSVAVAAAAPNEVLTGLTVKLNDLLSYGHPVLGSDINLWLDGSNRILPFSRVSAQTAARLQPMLQRLTLKDGWQAVPGYMLLRTQLKGPGWQQVILFPQSGGMKRTLDVIAAQLPFAVVTLLMLAVTLFWLLHRYLARPLWDFVAIIGKTGPHSLSARLPENRHDELGSIAHAYNLLLDTLRTQYDNLENVVAERTRALNEAKQQAERANKRKSSHLTTISHELRTPLSGSLGALELLQMTTLTDKQFQLADTARQCVFSLLSIINNLLDFSRIESGQLSLHIEETPLLPILDQAMHTIQGPGQSKGLTLRTFVGKQVPLYLDIDGMRLRQILVNLLGNALKFTQSGGIFLSVKRHDQQVIFAVNDSGQGIAPEDQADVFTPFFQSEGTMQGTGLGLAIAANLAKMMGGSLTLSSTPGLGTCMSFIMPLNDYREPHPLGGQLAAPLALHRQLAAWGISCEPSLEDGPFSAAELRFLPGKLYDRVIRAFAGDLPETTGNIPVQPWRLRILLVDDAVINREIIGMMLHSLGQDVTLAADGASALALGRQQPFDLVLMDVRMPDMDGTACARLWREDPENRDRDCMITALSANTAPEDIARCKEAGMRHYLTKPVTLAQLADGISYAAEYQLQRDIPLQEQDSRLTTSFLSAGSDLLRQKVHESLHSLLNDIELNVNDVEKISALLHTLKGGLGQAGLGELLCDVVDMENLVKHGLPLSGEQIAELRHALDKYLSAENASARDAITQEVTEYE